MVIDGDGRAYFVVEGVGFGGAHISKMVWYGSGPIPPSFMFSTSPGKQFHDCKGKPRLWMEIVTLRRAQGNHLLQKLRGGQISLR